MSNVSNNLNVKQSSHIENLLVFCMSCIQNTKCKTKIFTKVVKTEQKIGNEKAENFGKTLMASFQLNI